MKMRKALLCLMVSAVSAGYVSAGENESAKASSGDRFLEAPQAGSLDRSQATVVAAVSSQRKGTTLAAADATHTTARSEVPAPEKDQHQGTRAQKIMGVTLNGALMGAAFVLLFGKIADPAALAVGALIGAGVAWGIAEVMIK